MRPLSYRRLAGMIPESSFFEAEQYVQNAIMVLRPKAAQQTNRDYGSAPYMSGANSFRKGRRLHRFVSPPAQARVAVSANLMISSSPNKATRAGVFRISSWPYSFANNFSHCFLPSAGTFLSPRISSFNGHES